MESVLSDERSTRSGRLEGSPANFGPEENNLQGETSHESSPDKTLGSFNPLAKNSLQEAPGSQETAPTPTWKGDANNHPTCRAWCSCTCHVRSFYRLPAALKPLVGDLRLRCWSTSPRCNERSCHRSGLTKISAEFQLPAYLIKRYLVMRISSSVLGGPQFSLSVPRVTGWSNLLWSYAQNCQKEAIQRLFSDHKASPLDVNQQGTNALTYVLDDLDLTRFLLNHKADPFLANEHGRTASELLWEKAFAGHYGSEGACEVSIILQDQDYIDAREFSTIHKIVLGLIHKDLRAELETSTAYINIGDSRSRSPLSWAAIRNDEKAVRTLLEFGADPKLKDNLGDTALDFVQSADVCMALLEADIGIHSQNLAHGRSALHHFCSRKKSLNEPKKDDEVVELLINAGIDINVRDMEKETPLLRAVFAGRRDLVRGVLRRGADPNLTSIPSRSNAMHIAVLFDHHDMIPDLLAYGADYSAISKSGRHIAHYAARSAGTKTLQVLTQEKLVDIDLSLRDREGKTPADYIAERVVMQGSEFGIHGAFEIYANLVSAHHVNLGGARIVETTEPAESGVPKDLSEDIALPGSFPD